MSLKQSFHVATAVLSVSITARADIVYDTISGFAAAPTHISVSVPEHADDTTLSGQNLVLDTVELLCRLKSGSLLEVFDGTLTLRLRTTQSQATLLVPGATFYEAVVPVSIPRGSDLLVAFDIPEVQAPSPNIWASWYFTRSNGALFHYGDVWVRQSLAPPTVGTSTPMAMGTGDLTNPVWQPEANGRWYAIRITTVPAPAGLSVLLATSALAQTRRRAGKVSP